MLIKEYGAWEVSRYDPPTPRTCGSTHERSKMGAAMKVPQTRYATVGDGQVAYKAPSGGPMDLLYFYGLAITSSCSSRAFQGALETLLGERLIVSGIPHSAPAKFNRAHHHFQILKQSVGGFFDRHPYRMRPEPNDDLTEYRFYVDWTEDVPIDEWGLVFGDGVHCLRSALDHAVQGIAVQQSGQDPPPSHRTLEFPITSDNDAWSKAKWHVQTLSEPARRRIRRLQPHDDAVAFDMRPLGGLQEFDNTDKHRIIHVVTVMPRETGHHITGLIPGQQVTFDHRVGPIKNGTPTVTIALDRPTPDVKMASDLTLDIGIPRVRGDGRESTLPLWEVIDVMAGAVRDILVTLGDFC
jgi:hypothetical protein